MSMADPDCQRRQGGGVCVKSGNRIPPRVKVVMSQCTYDPGSIVMNHYKVNMSHHEVDMSHPEVIMSQSHYEPLHWLVVIISNLPFSLTRTSRSRGEYLRVVGVLEMVE